jgi:hypothetical protein
LLDWELWIRCDPEDQNRIIRHWSRSLYPSFPTLVQGIRSFSDILISVVGRGTLLKSMESRQALLSICTSMLPTPGHFRVFIADFVQATKPMIILELLRFFVQMLIVNPTMFSGVGESIITITYILNSAKLLKTNHNEFYSLFFQAVMLLHRNSLIPNCEIGEHIDAILYQLTDDIVQPTVFQALHELMINEQFRALLPVCSWMALALTIREVTPFVHSLLPNIEYCSGRLWSFWPIVLAVKLADRVLQECLIYFIVLSETESWLDSYILIDIAGEVLHEIVDPVKHCFVTVLSESIAGGTILPSENLMKSVFEIAQSFLFSGSSEALWHFFDRSPFQSEVPRSQSLWLTRPTPTPHSSQTFAGLLGRRPTNPPSKRRPIEHSMKRRERILPLQMFHRIVGLEEHKDRCGVKLRISMNGDWPDAGLAQRFVAIFTQQDDRSRLDFILLLCIYLARIDPKQATALVKELALTPKEITDFDHLLAAFAQHTTFEAQPSIEAFEKFCEISKTYSNPSIRVWLSVVRMIGAVRKKSECLIAQINEQVLLATNERQNGNLAKLDRRIKETAEAWRRLWRCMTVYRAPWSPFRGKDGITAWKRDPFLCRGLFPSKLQAYVGTKTNSHHPKSLSQWFAAGISGSGSGGEVRDFQGEIVNLSSVVTCLVSLRSEMIRIRYENGATRDLFFSKLVRVLHRTRFHEASAIEVFMDNGESLFVNIPGHNSFEFLNRLKAVVSQKVIVQTVPNTEFFASMKLTEMWLAGKLSNFDYLLRLNIFSGRSFHDVTQYPIFPWVLCDYSADALNLTDRNVFRDLRKSMIAADKQRLNDIITQNLKTHESSFLLGQYYLRAADVRKYLGGLANFSEQGLTSIPEAFDSAMHSNTNYSEIIPEFYFMPELFESNVELPKWANGSAMNFIYLHRKALESPIVTKSLPEWIDLIWGCKQKGSDADLSFNTFRPELYSSYIPKPSEDILSLRESYGLIPDQLFLSRHPSRTFSDQEPPSFPLDRPITVELPTDSDICFARIDYDENLTYQIGFVNDNGDLVQLRLNFLKHQRSSSSPSATKKQLPPNSEMTLSNSQDSLTEEQRLRIPIFSDFAKPLHPQYFAIFGHALAICDGEHSWVTILNTENGICRTIHHHDSDVICTARQGIWLVTAGRDAILNVFQISNLKSPYFRIPLYHDEITCCNVNADFSLIASGTRDGFLVLSSLTRGSNVKVVDLGGCRPYSVIITRNWGFVVVVSTKLEGGRLEHIIAVYTMNGFFIRSKQIPGPLAAWTSWTNSDGFDWLIIASDQGKLAFAEVVELELMFVKGYVAIPPVIAIRYLPGEFGIIVISGKGEVTLIPFNL